MDTQTYVGIHILWKRGTTIMFDMRIFNLDAFSYLWIVPENAIEKLEKENSDKYLQTYLEHRIHFTLIIYSSDGIVGLGAQVKQWYMLSHLRENIKR